MSLEAVWSEAHALHDPRGEVWIGLPLEGDEVPARGVVMRQVIDDLGMPVVPPRAHGLDPVLAVHNQEMVAYLETAYEEWAQAGYPESPGQDRVVAYVFPHPDALRHVAPHWPASRAARAGVFCMDTTTVIGPGTYEAARSAVDCALTAADTVLAGGRASYAAVRPPGHHAGTSYFGGSCYLNNAAITAQYLIDNGARSVGIIDIDAHHGNGTQQVFYDRADVGYLSLHIDPGAGWFPHFLGFSDETGIGAGEGANHNFPLLPGEGDDRFLDVLHRMCTQVEDAAYEAIVVSLGLDMASADENSPLQVTTNGFGQAGSMLAGLSKPMVLVQEGGYDLTSLRVDLTAILTPLLSN